MIGRYLTDAILIAVFTASVYLATFQYKIAYLEYFGIPALFTEVDLTSILIATSGLVAFLLVSIFVYLIIHGLLIYITRDTFLQTIFKDNGVSIPAMFTLVLVSGILYQDHFERYWIAIVTLIFLVVFYILIPIISPHYKQWLLKKAEINLEKRSAQGEINFLNIFHNPYGITLMIGLFFWLTISTGDFLGESAALTQTKYTLVSTTPPVVVLGNYKDTLLVTALGEENTLSGEFRLLNIQEIANNGYVFSKKNIEIRRVLSE